MFMAAPGTQFVAKSVSGTGSSPKTPGHTALAEQVGLPLQITPLESIETESINPNTPHKDPTLKKKSAKLVSKRKLFLQNGQGLHINKAKRHSVPKVTTLQTPPSRPTEAGPRGHYPLTERQQLQYLLEVTAKEAKQDSGSSSNDDLPFVSNKIKKKDISRDNHIEARIRKRNERGETALHVAAIRGDLEDVVAFIKAGAMVNAKDNAGWTPLHEACNYGNLRIVQELVWSGADVNSPGYEAITPLHDAVINDHIQVVKFLLENGADPKLQTSQNYSTAELARSAAVQKLVSPERTTRDYYTTYSHESQPLPHPSQFDEPNFDLPGAKINGLNSSYSERSLYSGGFEPVVHLDAKNDAPPVFLSVEHSQNKEMCVNPRDNFGIGSGNHCNKQYFYDFPRNAHHFSNESDVDGSKERDDLSATLSSAEAVKRIDEGAGHFQQPHCYGVVSTDMEPGGNTQVVDKMNVAESSSENLVQNHVKECTSDIARPNSLEESIATETLVQINARQLSAKKPDETVTQESEEDTVAPEKLNECLDKAMIEISSYLETSQNFDVQTPCDERELSKGDSGLIKNCRSVAEDRSFANESSTPHRPLAVPLETGLSDDYSQEDQQLGAVSQPGETELKTSESNAVVSDLTNNGTDCFERQQVGNFTKVKSRSEKRREGMEKGGKTGRRKRSSTRSSESSKCDSNQSVVKEECTSHIPNVTWRSELSKYRYSVSAIPLRVPGYEDFLINSRNGSKPLLNERNKDPSNSNQLDKVISQHDNEKVKLRMSLEQELVRLFGNFARKTAGYQVPYSACSVITSQMRPVGVKRVSVQAVQLASIKVEVNKILNKFNRLKVEMLNRHNREIEVVIALGKFWTHNEELTGASRLPARLSTSTNGPTTYSEDFELLPAKFNEYYEEVLCATD